MIVPPEPRVPLDIDCRVARPTSSLRVALPLAGGAAHQLGHVADATHGAHCHADDAPIPTASDAYRYQIRRHPSMLYLDVSIRVHFVHAAKGTERIIVQAGVGPAVFVPIAGPGTVRRWIVVRAPWGATPAGVADVVVWVEDANFSSISFMDVPRSNLIDTDADAPQILDPLHPAIGLPEGRAIAESQAGPAGAVAAIEGAWEQYRRSACVWSCLDTDAPSYSGGAFAPIFADGTGPLILPHSARQARGSETQRYYDIAMRTRVTGGADYILQATVTAGAYSTAPLAGAAYVWHVIPSVKLAADADDGIDLAWRVSGGAGDIYIAGLAIYESDAPVV